MMNPLLSYQTSYQKDEDVLNKIPFKSNPNKNSNHFQGPFYKFRSGLFNTFPNFRFTMALYQLWVSQLQHVTTPFMEWFSPSTATKIPIVELGRKKTNCRPRWWNPPGPGFHCGSCQVGGAIIGATPGAMGAMPGWTGWTPQPPLSWLSLKIGGGTISVAIYYLGEPAQFINQGARLNPGLTLWTFDIFFCPDWYRNRTHHLLARGSVGMPGILEWWGCNTLKNEESYLFF